MNLFPYMVIYPKGDRNILDVAYVVSYEEDEWDLASKKRFETETEAQQYAAELSKNHGVPLSYKVPKYLD